VRFGPVPVGEAAGAVLAHTHRLPGRRILKKGRVLSPEDVAHLAEAGHRDVIVARIDPGDVPEDEAAARVAGTVAGDRVRVGEASTGRANLFARDAGVLLVDADAVDAVNLVDEAITVGTLAPRAVVAGGEMVGTVKVIPFAVAGTTLDRVVDAAAARAPLVQVAPFRRRRAGLVLTRLPGMSESLLDRAAASQRARMERFGGRLIEEARCPHAAGDVAEAVRSMLRRGVDLVLLMGASAIVDRGDVIPQGLEGAGGEVVHLGMPVDPGNLLLLGALGDGPERIPAVGVPGCARSLKESGFDWVLARLCAGLPVDGPAIMRMGAGGLLKEIAARPQPRQSPPRTPAVVDGQPRPPRLGAVVLAAGRSRRMGDRNKLLEPVDGKPLVAHSVDALLDAGVSPVVVVLGHEADRVRAVLGDRAGLRFVHNPDYAEGMSTSLRTGIQALTGDELDGAFVALGDMPWVRARHLEALREAFAPAEERAICVPVHRRKRGNPVLWGASFFPEMQRVTGDVGARGLLRAHPDQVHLVPVDDPAVHLDVDTPDALAEVRGHGNDDGGARRET